MRKIRTLFSMKWSEFLQYRADMVLWTLAEAITPLVALAVWYTVAQSSNAVLTTQETLTYYILVIFVGIITSAWNGFFFAREILNGEIVKFLIKPLSVFWHHISNNLVEKSFKLSLPILLLIIVLLFNPELLVTEVYQVPNILLFIVSIVLALVISFTLDMSIGAIAFWLEDANEIRSYKLMLESISSGLLIPFALMPPFLFSLFSFLPFRYIISAPIEILMGQVTGGGAIQLIFYQVLWAVGLTLLLKLLWTKGLQTYAVPGQ